MDSLRCSVVVCFHPASAPFLIENVNSYDYNDQPPYTPLLQSVFGKVFVHSNHTDALGRVKQIKHGSPTILLLDLDTYASATLDDTDNDDDDTVYTPSCSSSCSTDSSSSSCVIDSRLVWVKRTTRDLDQSVPVIACSANDNATFMLDCIRAGATDYLLKPLHMDVIKTLFLKLHRDRRPDSKMYKGASSFLPTSLPPTPTPPYNASAIYPDDGLQHRINEIFAKDTRLTQSVMDIYGNQLVPRTKCRGLPRERSTLLQHKVSCWDFNPFELSRDDLIHCAYLIFQQVLVLPELSYLAISFDQLYDFIIDLSGAYHDGNPYHNFAHAVDVLQCLYYFLCRLGILSFYNTPMNHTTTTTENLPRHNQLQYLLQPKHVFALLIAALGHDAAHPGVNNAFLINSSAALALLYSDRSVLESLHSMVLFQVLKKHGFDQIGGGPSSADYKEFRKVVVTSILSTDMALHNDYVERIKAVRIANVDFEKLDSAACENERLLICSALIKCADISNVTRPFNRAVKWAELLIEECIRQGDLERAMGLPSMPLNDRDKVVLEDSQVGFIKFVALGLFEAVRDVLPEMAFTVECINDNLKRWEDHKTTAHDSGVSSLSAPTTTTTTTTLAGTKRRNSSLDYKAVEVFRKRLLLDNDQHSAIEAVRRRSVGSIMPAADYHRRIYKMKPAYTRVGHHHHHHHHHHEPPPEASSPSSEWSQDEPVHCNCTIQ